jgi:hypothetical protein
MADRAFPASRRDTAIAPERNGSRRVPPRLTPVHPEHPSVRRQTHDRPWRLPPAALAGSPSRRGGRPDRPRLIVGGLYLIHVGGSPYYALAGLGLILTAWLLWRGSALALWLYGLGSQATLVDFPTDGGPVPALVLPSKQGDIYVLDRRTGRRRRAAAARADPAAFALPHAAQGRPHREGHVGHVADRPDDLPHRVPHRHLPGILHAADVGDPQHRVSRLQRRLGLGRHRRRSGARHHRRQRQRHAELRPPGAWCSAR